MTGSTNYAHEVFSPIATVADLPISIDYNAEAQEIYWISNSSKAILKASALGGNSTMAFQLDDRSLPTGLAVDWITGNIYYADDGQSQIGVASPDGSYQAVVMTFTSSNYLGYRLPMLSDLAVNAVLGYDETDQRPQRYL